MLGKIYSLQSSEDNKIRYIGQTINSLNRRLSAHIYDVKRSIKKNKQLSYKENWINKFLKSNTVHLLTISTIEECDISVLDDREKYWINFYKSSKLTNIAEGGKRRWITEEMKKKISLANSGKNNGMYGKKNPHSVESIEKLKKSLRNSEKFRLYKLKCSTEEHRQKVRVKQRIDDVLLLDLNLNIIKVYDSISSITKDLDCTKSNIIHARKDKRKLMKKYWVTYKKDYEKLCNKLNFPELAT
jgi:group I intron endonuclease